MPRARRPLLELRFTTVRCMTTHVVLASTSPSHELALGSMCVTLPLCCQLTLWNRQQLPQQNLAESAQEAVWVSS